MKSITSPKPTKTQLNQLFVLLHKAGKYHTRKDYLRSLTQGRVFSMKDLSLEDARIVATDLNQIIKDQDDRKKKMGKKIIHLLCEVGMTKEDATPDYDRINAFVVNIGSRNESRKKLWDLSYDEMLEVLNQVDQYHKKQLKR